MAFRFKTIIAASALALSTLVAPAMAQDAYGDWDTDGTAGVSEDEFGTGMGDIGLYGDWDADGDGNLTETEFNDGLFGTYDDNGDGVIEEPEFGDLNDDMGDGGLFDV